MASTRIFVRMISGITRSPEAFGSGFFSRRVRMTSTRSFGRMKPPAAVSGEISVDIARILATEIVIAADTLMDDIHDLALAYHWSEEAILALAPVRRRGYLQRLRG